MDDDTRPNDPTGERPPDEEEPKEEKPTRSHLDRLMGAKERAELEAARWSEIEERGEPVPSADQPAPPPIEMPPAPEQPQPPRSEVGVRRPQGPPSFPHPTDPVPEPSSAPHPTDAEPEAPPPPPPDLSYEPPVPSIFDEETASEVIPRPGSEPHQRYQPPPEEHDDVRLDEQGMPLPRRVTEEDLDATIVGKSAYSERTPQRPEPPTEPHGYPRMEQPVETPQFQTPPPQQSRAVIPPVTPPPQPPPQPSRPASARRSESRRRGRRKPRITWKLVGRLALLSFVMLVVAIVLGSGGAAIYYSQVTAPSFVGIHTIGDLQQKALQFQTTRIRDSQGNVLYEINDPNGGRRTYVTLDEVSPWVIVATVATEEREYFTNPGFSIPAIVRAVIKNTAQGEATSGASTITQQLARALLLPEDERAQRTYARKVKEIFLAAELGRRFSKQEVLELYLNQIYYGNLAYGIEAAAETYFGKHASELNLAEAAFLAGLPQGPAIYDPVTNPSAARARANDVLRLMLDAGCIDTGNTGLDLSEYCTTGDLLATPEVQQELRDVSVQTFEAPAINAKYPHWVVYVQQELERELGSNALYTGGYDVYTTLDPRLQDVAQEMVTNTIDGLAAQNVDNASVVIVNIHTGAILAMVGSKDFNDESIDGQVNVALTPQQPGSSIKPFTYMAAFRQGWNPATVIWDVPIEYDIPGFGIYAPHNYSGRFYGPTTLRYALANSRNVPAVLTLDHVGISALLQVLNDVHITTLGDPSNPNNYGLSLTLGAGEVYLLEWTDAYAAIANGGVYHPTYAIERIERNGQVIDGYPYQVPEGEQVFDPQDDYLLQNILSDKEARIPGFGANSPLSPPYPAGAKTGTTNDFRDNWTMGFTTEIAVGVWVGNTDNSPMLNVTGVTGAGPIWRGIMDAAAQMPEYLPAPFPRPSGIFEREVCVDDGALFQGYTYCNEHSSGHTEIFVSEPPSPDQGLYRTVKVDTFTGLLSNQYCQDFTEDRLYLALPDISPTIDTTQAIRDWLLNTDGGRQWAADRGITEEMINTAPPTESCTPDTPQPQIAITFPEQDSTQPNDLTITGTADAPNFDHYRVEYGVSWDPQAWGVVTERADQPVHDGVLGHIDLSAYEDGPMSVRVIVYDTAGHSAERRVTFTLVKPTPTATPVPSETPTLAPTATPIPTSTPTATPTIFQPQPIITVTPGETPTEEPSPTP